MVKHFVCWKLTEGAKKRQTELAADLAARFHALLGVVDGLTAIELGENYNGGEYDLALLCEFVSREAERGYQNHPAHLAIKAIVHENVCGRACVDYEL